MCSRFWGAPEGTAILTAIEEKGVEAILEAINEGSSNVAPTELQPVVHMENGQAIISRMKWGFTIPGRQPIINARIETVLEKGLFAQSAINRRCLIAVQGFYEWDKTTKPKQPYCFRMKDGAEFAFAGLWRVMNGEKQFVVCTTEPNELVAQLHNRMPCVVASSDFNLWLKGDTHEALSKITVPFPAELMTCFKVKTAMSNPRYKAEDAPEPLRDLFDI